jgi:hypothetical protein
MGRGPARAMAVIGTMVGLGAAGGLMWNEWQLARRLGALDAAGRSLVPAGLDPGRPVHVVGEASAPAPARDTALGVAAEVLRLDRVAETYQWLEQKEGSGDNKNLRYEKVWSPVSIRSERFEQRSTHVNPATLPLRSGTSFAEGARIGEWALDEALVAALPATRELRPEGHGGTLAAAGMTFRRSGDWLHSGDPKAPAIGDVRVRLAAAPEGLVSVIGTSDGAGRLVPWRAPNGGVVALAAYGEVAPEELLRAAARGGWREAWTYRGFGALGMVVAVIFASPALAMRLGGDPAFHGRRRLGTILLIGMGLAALVCAVGWVGARLLAGPALLLG